MGGKTDFEEISKFREKNALLCSVFAPAPPKKKKKQTVNSYKRLCTFSLTSFGICMQRSVLWGDTVLNNSWTMNMYSKETENQSKCKGR